MVAVPIFDRQGLWSEAGGRYRILRASLIVAIVLGSLIVILGVWFLIFVTRCRSYYRQRMANSVLARSHDLIGPTPVPCYNYPGFSPEHNMPPAHALIPPPSYEQVATSATAEPVGIAPPPYVEKEDK